MYETLVVLLRGINVGGASIAMEDLRETLKLPGVAQVRTVLATGNAILRVETRHDACQWKERIEFALRERFRYDAHVFVLNHSQMSAVAEQAEQVVVPMGCHLYALLLEDEAMFTELKALFDKLPRVPQEQFLPMECGAFWVVPRGSTVESAFGNKALGDKRYKARLTSRNINTWHKVLQAMADNT
jgi:uncharacterized protein (DUF1697 family)